MPASGGRSASKRLTSSAAKCCASAAEPPLPQASALPPLLSDSASSTPARATGAPSACAASSFSLALSAKCAATRPRSFASACPIAAGWALATPDQSATNSALLAKRVANPLHMARRPVDQEHIEAAGRVGPPREVEPGGGDQPRALRGGDALGGAAEATGRAHAHLGEYQRAALF